MHFPVLSQPFLQSHGQSTHVDLSFEGTIVPLQVKHSLFAEHSRQFVISQVTQALPVELGTKLFEHYSHCISPLQKLQLVTSQLKQAVPAILVNCPDNGQGK